MAFSESPWTNPRTILILIAPLYLYGAKRPVRRIENPNHVVFQYYPLCGLTICFRKVFAGNRCLGRK